MNTEQEIWVDIQGLEGYYQVSNLARVRSLDRVIITKKGVKANYKSRLMRLPINASGYFATELSKNDKGHAVLLHREVAKAFIPNPASKPCINHINGIKTDNRIENLEWCTQQENVYHTYHVLGYKNPFGETNGKSVSIVAIHPNGFKENIKGINNAARKLNLHTAAIWKVLIGRQKQHKGYFFEYAQISNSQKQTAA